MPDLEEIHRVKDVAKMLNVSKETIYNWCKNGTIKCIKIGSTILIKDSEVRRLIDDNGKDN